MFTLQTVRDLPSVNDAVMITNEHNIYAFSPGTVTEVDQESHCVKVQLKHVQDIEVWFCGQEVEKEPHVIEAEKEEKILIETAVELRKGAAEIRGNFEKVHRRPCDTASRESALQYGRAQGLDTAAEALENLVRIKPWRHLNKLGRTITKQDVEFKFRSEVIEILQGTWKWSAITPSLYNEMQTFIYSWWVDNMPMTLAMRQVVDEEAKTISVFVEGIEKPFVVQLA